jgi:bifunctional oligoribonuclease and PAP phosphatase NrnA
MLPYNKEFKQLIEKSKNILIVTHKSPDVDAFCSMILIKLLIEQIDSQKKVVMKARQMPTARLPRMKEITLVKELREEEEDLIVVVDAGNLNLCVDFTKDPIKDTNKMIVCIDHHTETEMQSNGLTINEIRSSATEQVFATFKDILGKKFKITEDIAELVQYGIVADTGRFLYNTYPETLRIFADAKATLDVDMEEMAYNAAKFPSEASPAIITYLKTLTIEKDMAYMYISEEEIVRNGLTKTGVNEAQAFLRDKYIRFIQGVHWGFVIKPDFDNEDTWFVSFRSTKGYQEVGSIAQLLGGGGHPYASASPLKAKTVDEALDLVLNAVHKIVK